MNPSNFIGPVAAFVLILALIPAALWLLRRTPMGGAASGTAMRLVGALPLAPNQRIVTVEVGSGEHRRWLVLGVTPAGISALHTLAPQAEAPTAPAGALPGFAALLQRQQRGNQAPASGPGSPDAR